MDPRYSAQDVVRCALCRDAVVPMHCNVCNTHLCGDCVAKHFSDKSKVHTVVPLEQSLSTVNYPKCTTHPTKQCELHCEQCDIPICSRCISSGKHIGHKAVDIFEDFEIKKEVLSFCATVAMDSVEERNILLIGKLGAGKSHIGNGILGLKDYFPIKRGRTSCRICKYGSATRNAKRYRVFDTPGIYRITDTDVFMDIKRVLLCASRGFHAIVFVLSAAERITGEDVIIFESLNEILEIRGSDFMMMAVTKIDVDYERLDKMIEDEQVVKQFDMTCHSRRVIFGDNMQEIPATSLQRFDKELENLVLKNRRNGNEYLRHENYKKASEILTEDKTDYMKKHPGISSDVAMEIVRIKAALGESPREEKLREIMGRSLGGCVIF